MHSMFPSVRHKTALSLLGFMLAGQVGALECGKFEFPNCDGPDMQYADGFDPQVGYGGFGGGDCIASKTPVIFIHGNADRAINWDSPVIDGVEHYSPPTRSVYAEFKQHGYNDCELFGVTYLNAMEQANPQNNYHRPDKEKILSDFIAAVMAYTKKDKVDIVTHSLGVSMTMAALRYSDSWNSVRRFVNIAGGIRGLKSCAAMGYMNPLTPTCDSENIFNPYFFGLFPDNGISGGGRNDWTGANTEFSLRRVPKRHPDVSFYTLLAGKYDEIHCSTLNARDDCAKGALFSPNSNVKAQLNLGAGSIASASNLIFTGSHPGNPMGGDTDGIGHFKVKNNSGQILYTILNSDCRGIACAGNYAGGPVVED